MAAAAPDASKVATRLRARMQEALAVALSNTSEVPPPLPADATQYKCGVTLPLSIHGYGPWDLIWGSGVDVAATSAASFVRDDIAAGRIENLACKFSVIVEVVPAAGGPILDGRIVYIGV